MHFVKKIMPLLAAGLFLAGASPATAATPDAVVLVDWKPRGYHQGHRGPPPRHFRGPPPRHYRPLPPRGWYGPPPVYYAPPPRYWRPAPRYYRPAPAPGVGLYFRF
ncbi:hypothetical protein [Falsiroseomonas selenitidurans]|uniref:Uncharacterized protein n=1 Tax=Falsiroseomonas selenitidurans TaxID=2716335 RepID=A0ABX1DYL7_9PROT|nr:hypothetical protein [Falsiroseomonas selenitidurans]NKC29578.1 hypothetical protein [Falsiroseomonas selenitidurans]